MFVVVNQINGCGIALLITNYNVEIVMEFTKSEILTFPPTFIIVWPDASRFLVTALQNAMKQIESNCKPVLALPFIFQKEEEVNDKGCK